MADKTFFCVACKTHKPILTGCTTGYAKDDKGRKVCFACCGERDRQFMIDKGVNTLYLTAATGQPGGLSFDGVVANWPGTLSFQGRVKVGRHNIAGKRYDVWFNGPDGQVWHGVTYGDNTQICHCKRTKQKVA